MCKVIGVGQGITACVFFLWLIAFENSDRTLIIVEIIFLASLFAVLIYIVKKRSLLPEANDEFEVTSGEETFKELKYGWLLPLAFYTSLASAISIILIALLRTPSGMWDAWAIWNLRARHILRAEAYWRDSFSNLVAWSHPDYPLLLPLSVARGWLYAGSETTLVPSVLSLLFFLGTVGLLCSALAELRGKSQGFIAGIVLLGYTTFTQYAGSQYAEPPLIFFFTATIILFAFKLEITESSNNLLILAGITAGLSAWTKNEGLLFILSIGVAQLIVVLAFQGLKAYLKQLSYFLVGLLPVMVIIIYFKTHLAPPNELTSSMLTQATLNKLLDYNRYIYLVQAFKERILFHNIYGISLIYLLLVYLVCIGTTLIHKRSVICITILLCLMLTGYGWVYLTTPYDLPWHLATSFERITLHLLPGFIFLFFLIALTPEETLRQNEN